MREIKKGYRRVQFILKSECVKELKRMALEEGETLQSLIETAILQAYFEDDPPDDEEDDGGVFMERQEMDELEKEYRAFDRKLGGRSEYM